MDNSNEYKFILVISGMSSKSIRAVENIRRIGDKHLPGNYKLEIVDINKNKEKATLYQIVAVPTLIKEQPQPTKIIVGDLSDTKKVLKILDLIE